MSQPCRTDSKSNGAGGSGLSRTIGSPSTSRTSKSMRSTVRPLSRTVGSPSPSRPPGPSGKGGGRGPAGRGGADVRRPAKVESLLSGTGFPSISRHPTSALSAKERVDDRPTAVRPSTRRGREAARAAPSRPAVSHPSAAPRARRSDRRPVPCEFGRLQGRSVEGVEGRRTGDLSVAARAGRVGAARGTAERSGVRGARSGRLAPVHDPPAVALVIAPRSALRPPRPAIARQSTIRSARRPLRRRVAAATLAA